MIQEIELKYLFKNKKDYLIFLKAFPGSHRIEKQINYFFDTPDFKLKQHSVFVRIRKTGTHYILTCKMPSESRIINSIENLSIFNEWEQEIPDFLGNSPLTYIKQYWPQLEKRIQDLIQRNSLILIGSFENIRTYIPYKIQDHDLTLEVDATKFKTHTDYELELELSENLDPNRAKGELQKLFTRLNIRKSALSSTRGKAERFFADIAQNTDPHGR